MLASLGLGTVLAGLPGAALAQAVPDLQNLVTQSEQVNRGVAEAIRARTGAGAGADGAIDGEAGIYVLTVNEIFQISAAGGLGYTDNPQRTADDLGGSYFGEFSINAGIATKLGGLVDLGLSANVAGREFFDESAPDSRSASASLSVGAPIFGPVYAGLVGFGGYSYDGDFKRGTGFYGVSGNISGVIPITPRLVLRPGLGATRQWAEVAENDSFLVAASADVFYAVTPQFSASLRGSLVRRWYDDFYEDVTFVARRDWLYGVTAALSYQPMPNLVVAATLSYETQDSRFFLAQFDAFEGTAGMSFRLRF